MKKITLLLTLIIVSFALVGCGETSNPTTTQTSNQEQKEVTSTYEEETTPTYTEIGSYKDLFSFKAIKVKSGISKAKLIELAQEIHTENPDQRYDIFTDDAMFKKWKENTTGTQMNMTAKLQKWTNKHYMGNITLMSTGEWQLNLENKKFNSSSAALN